MLFYIYIEKALILASYYAPGARRLTAFLSAPSRPPVPFSLIAAVDLIFSVIGQCT